MSFLCPGVLYPATAGRSAAPERIANKPNIECWPRVLKTEGTCGLGIGSIFVLKWGEGDTLSTGHGECTISLGCGRVLSELIALCTDGFQAPFH